MFKLIFISVAFTLLVGLTVKRITDWRESDYEISWPEFAIGSAVASLIIVPLVVVAGWHIALSNMVRYHEWYNGWEQAALVDTTVCTKDGSCQYTYDCDPYQVAHTSTDSKGNTTTYYTTEYHSCPYVDEEFHYFVKTTLPGDGERYYMGGTRWAQHPSTWHGYGDGDRDGMPSVPRGAPKEWIAAKERISFHDNGPVTRRYDYDNFILASQSTILKQYSDSIKRYQKSKLLPPVAKDTYAYYQAHKVYDLSGDLPSDWTPALARLNAAFGTELQGDLHVVVVDDALDADNYALSLQAYWGSPAMKKDALSKNGLVLVLGSDGERITWARDFTGMPLGNNQLLSELRDKLVGQPLDAKVLLGHPTVDLSSGKPKVQHTDGLIEGILWGDHKFERISMSGGGKDDHGTGYLYLKNELQPGDGARWVTFLIATFLSLLVWVVALAVGSRSTLLHKRGRSSHWDNW